MIISVDVLKYSVARLLQRTPAVLDLLIIFLPSNGRLSRCDGLTIQNRYGV
jgi:hypothetical protein